MTFYEIELSIIQFSILFKIILFICIITISLNFDYALAGHLRYLWIKSKPSALRIVQKTLKILTQRANDCIKFPTTPTAT